MLVVRSDVHRAHHGEELDGGVVIPSWEHPGRADYVDDATDALGFPTSPPAPLDRSLVESVHDPAYVAFLETAWHEWKRAGHDTDFAMPFTWPVRRMRQRCPDNIDGALGYYSFAADCSIGSGTFDAAQESAAIAQTAADRLDLSSPAEAVFARCRPPGHHASRDQFGGYCYLNNAAIAAQRLRDRGVERVALLDVDYHHGNGTQDIFYERSDVAFASIHADPVVAFPYFSGHADESGHGPGAGLNRNLPLPHGTGADEWFRAFGSAADWISGLTCGALVVSLGVDTFVDDPISQFRLVTPDFLTLGARLRELGLPTVFVLEGGYATEALGDNVAAVLSGFEAG